MKRTTRLVVDEGAKARFFAKVAPANGDGCELWTAYKGPDGRGRMTVGSIADGSARAVLAPRVAYTIANGPIPDGGVIGHDCGNVSCVAASHLNIIDTNLTWQERLFARCVPDENGCWIWQGFTHASGYGHAMITLPGGDRRLKSAHRWAYIATHGSVADDLEVDHLCNVRACINPDHLEAVTKNENMRRRSERQTHCKWGHERTAENTYPNGGGCRTCSNARNAATRQAASA